MQLLVYIIFYPLLWGISILPFRVLYVLSDGISFLLYKVFRYRVSVVMENLKLVFPKKTDTELRQIASKFYTHFCDLFLEMIKTLSISRKELNTRFVIKNPEVIQQLESQQTSIVMMFGHYASYEWSTVVQSHIRIEGLAIYKKITNAYFDTLVKKIRSKYNTELVDSKQALRRIRALSQVNSHRMIGFLSDQSPKLKKKNVWLDFMGIPIPCFIGAEATAKTYNYPVGYLHIEKVKRGYYEAKIIIISENPRAVDDFKITETFNQLLENQIQTAPEYYLWTHKRWKHKDRLDLQEE